ncbi:MAG: hypothetical protein JW987_01265 [Anaerolineaceae bacterium]|nr:hypothetical protein [Anaerolineaceae bacterium]
MFSESVKAEIEQELARATTARQEGFEGRARVCARRATGVAIREYRRLRGEATLRANAYDLLAGLRDEVNLSEENRQAVEHLLLRVDEEFRLPEEIDLLVEAKSLIDALEKLAS